MKASIGHYALIHCRLREDEQMNCNAHTHTFNFYRLCQNIDLNEFSLVSDNFIMHPSAFLRTSTHTVLDGEFMVCFSICECICSINIEIKRSFKLCGLFFCWFIFWGSFFLWFSSECNRLTIRLGDSMIKKNRFPNMNILFI